MPRCSSAVPHEFVWDHSSHRLPHPNTLRAPSLDAAGNVLQAWTVCSTGGGSLADGQGPPSAEADPARHPCCNTISEALRNCEEHPAHLLAVRGAPRECRLAQTGRRSGPP